MTKDEFLKELKEEEEYEPYDYIILSTREMITPEGYVVLFDDFDDLLNYRLDNGETVKEAIENIRLISFEFHINNKKKEL